MNMRTGLKGQADDNSESFSSSHVPLKKGNIKTAQSVNLNALFKDSFTKAKHKRQYLRLISHFIHAQN